MKIDQLTLMGLCGFLKATSIHANEPVLKNLKPNKIPNIFLILADNDGCDDLNFYRSTRYVIAKLDKLAASGVGLVNFIFCELCVVPHGLLY